MADFAPVELAMFPLESAPLPDEDLPLHIFEPRYAALVRDCMDTADPRFGVVLISRGREVGGGVRDVMSGRWPGSPNARTRVRVAICCAAGWANGSGCATGCPTIRTRVRRYGSGPTSRGTQ